MPESKAVIEPYWVSLCGRAKVYVGDNLRVMAAMDQDQFHAICTDPPYNLSFMGRDWDKPGENKPGPDPTGYYFSGLIDGEGCFRIHKEKGSAYYACHFSMKLRRDDRAILEKAARFYRVGCVRDVAGDKTSKPQSIFVVQSRDECVKLREIIRRYPLRAKKRRDFEVWSTALDSWLDQGRGNRWRGPALKTAMRDAYLQMKQTREYTDRPWSGHPFQDWIRERAEVMLRITKPGGHILSFGGTRTYHRMACGLEEAGWEYRDCLMWLYSTGFPKGQDISKAIDKMIGAERTEVDIKRRSSALGGRLHSEQAGSGGYGFGQEWGASEPVTDAAKQWRGWNTQLKPSYEPVVMARKPIPDTVAECVLTNGTGAINIDECRVGTTGQDIVRDIHTKTSSGTGVYGFNEGAAGEETMRGGYSEVRKDGRHPANVAHDGSVEVVSRMPEGTARFFYTAKADSSDRPHDRNSDAAVHLTVKPLDLMRWLVRLVCARGGTVLDPFMGSGSTGVAALLEGQRFVGIEQSQEYADIAVGRLKLALAELGDDACAPAPGAPLKTSPLSAPTARKLRGVE